MATGANFKIENGRVLWYKPLIHGDNLLSQDHEARAKTRQGSYRLHPQYGNPFITTLSSEISETERNMLLPANMKECTLQDSRFVDCIVDESSIQEIDGKLTFRYELIKTEGGSLQKEFSGA